jgi:hypothetical protein
MNQYKIMFVGRKKIIDVANLPLKKFLRKIDELDDRELKLLCCYLKGLVEGTEDKRRYDEGSISYR